MSGNENSENDPLQGTQVMSTVATGGGGGVFQARVGALYLANMLTGLPTAFSLDGSRVEMLRFEARYAGAHTDDIFCQLSGASGTRLLLIQCKRGLKATPRNTPFVDALQAAWRDFLGVEGSPFDRSCDLLVLATIAPAIPANHAAKRLCELSRASLDLSDFRLKLDSKLFDRRHKDAWETFKEVSRTTLADKYTEELVFQLLCRLRIDIHDLGTESSQELSLVQALLTSGQSGGSSELVWAGLFAYVFEQGITVGTVTRETWASTAKAGLRDAVSRLSTERGLVNVALRFGERARLQLSLISTELPNGARIPRGECVAQVLAGLDERQLVIVTGGPGAGKSAVISKLAPLLRESGPLFFFRADELDSPSLASVQSLTTVPDAVLGMASFLRTGRPTVVIDSLEKALEAQNPGAIVELLALIRQNTGARLCITTRSYGLNPLYSNFLASLSCLVVDIPPLTDAEIAAAVAGSSLEEIVAKDSGVREVLRAPYYLKLAFIYSAGGAALPQVSGNDLRLLLWTERVAPSKGLPAGMAARRRAAFDAVCHARTARFSQFVQAPADAEAISSLLRDAVLAEDPARRVAPTHDVLEDWSLFFSVERDVRNAERDWVTLFAKLGSHAGMRRALRTWTAQRTAEGDGDAYALLEAALRHDSTIPQLWRDEIAIGLLRSERVEELVATLASNVSFSSVILLKRLSHLLRVACKGPTSIDYSGLADDPANKEIIVRLGMAAPVGKAWDVVIGLVAKAFPSLPAENDSWVVQLAEDAMSYDANWHQPSQRVADVFSIAEHFCWRDNDTWYRKQSIGKRFYALLCRCSGADPVRFKAFIDPLLQRLTHDRDYRDLYAEERLEFLVNFKSCREPSFFLPDLVREAFWKLYTEHEPPAARDFGEHGWEADLGLSQRAAHNFFPPSVLQGPFRPLLLYSFPETVQFVIDICNHAAVSFAGANPNEVSIIPLEQSPSGRPHIHDWRLWVVYRAHSVTSCVLNCALMALEERLLIEAKVQPELVSQAIDIVLEAGESSLTTGLAAGILIAHPELVTEKMLSIFKCPQFFADDMARCVREPSSLAIRGGHDGLDNERQKERMASNRLPHRQHNLEGLALRLQLGRPEIRDAVFAILDKHLETLKGSAEVPDGWRMALKRMDARGLKLGEPKAEGELVPLEIANLEPDLQRASERAQEGMQRMNRLSAIRLWAAAVTGRYATAEPGTSKRFLSPTEPYEEFLRLQSEIEGQESDLLLGLEDELACALIQKWPGDTSPALQWAKAFLLEAAAQREDKDAWLYRDPTAGELRAQTVILLASVDANLPNMVDALVNIVTEPVWKLRRVAANAISKILRSKQPVLADVLTSGLSQYAEALDVTIERASRRTRDTVDEARAAIAMGLGEDLRKMKPGVRCVPKSLAAIREWTIALDAARGETPDTWRVQSLTKLVRLIADQEGGARVRHHDPEDVDFEARWEMGDLLAAELMDQTTDQSRLFETLDYCLEFAPELSERVLESTLSACMTQEFATTEAFWRVWNRSTAKILPDESLRTSSRRSYSKYDKVLRTLLLCSIPWPKAWLDLPLFRSQQNFVANCLTAVGDSRPGLENLLMLMAGVGRITSVPSALPQLRDALAGAPGDLLDDGTSRWHAETICRVAVHEHREELLRDVNLRRATLDILDRLVDAGSSLGFQLRDYLATSPALSANAAKQSRH